MIFSIRYSFLLTIISLFTLIEPINAQYNFDFSGSRKRENIEFIKTRGLIVVKTYINENGPFNFILDTGVGSVIITDTGLKDSLNLKFLREMELSGLGEGNSLQAYTVPFLKISIGSAIAQSLSAAILKEDVFNLSAYCGMPIHGLVGYDFFQSFVVKIRNNSNYLTIYKHRKLRLIRKGYKIPIELLQNKPYLNLMVDVGEKKKLPLKILLDTGAGHPISLESLDNKDFPLPDNFMIANLGVGLGGKIRGFLGRIDNLKIGRFNVEKPICSFPYFSDVAGKITSVQRNGSIGNQLLKKFDMVFDYEKGNIYIKPNSSFKSPIEHDMSGIELYSDGKNYNQYFVSRVEPNSPAEEFGIEKGDQLLSINFKLVENMSFNEILDILKSKDGRNIYLELKHEKENYAGVFTLKRRL